MDRLAEELTTQFPPGPHEVGNARRAVASSLRRWGIEGPDADIAILLTSELVTNAVVHGRGTVTVQVRWDAARILRIEVSDADTQHVEPKQAALDDDDGRGLYLVDILADTWGTERAPDGKRIWFELSHL